MASKLTQPGTTSSHAVAKWSMASSISRRISLLVALTSRRGDGVVPCRFDPSSRPSMRLVNAARLGAQSVADDRRSRGAIDPLVRDVHDL